MTRVRLVRLIGCAVAVGVTLAMASCGTPSATDSASPDSTVQTTPSASASDPAATALPTDGTSTTPTPTPTVMVSQPPASSTMDGVEATGGFGDVPTVTVPSPWAIDRTQTKILVQGDGPTVSDTGYVQVNYLGVDARTGATFDDSYARGTASLFSLSGVVPGFQKGLAGQKVGTRLIIAMPGADGYDANGGKSDAGIALGDTLVFVVDILQAQFTEPTGATQVVTDSSLPKVSDDLAAPTVTIATTD
ncbi:MAG: FKBP-type peptidyl-prolyl cis-trans isomerase, partial [Propionibacteriaceae bacterium]|nr:FKBP-type peptidyl-prolyl cis-trans isomerase [Propionibacteriaceae bacterium]